MRRASLAAAALLAVCWLVSFGIHPWDDESVSDLPRGASLADAFLEGELPYRDQFFEYPPLAAPVVVLGGIGGTGVDEYRVGLGVVMFLFALAVVLLCGRLAAATGGDPLRTMLAAALVPVLVGAIVRNHFDLAAMALMLAALLTLVRDRAVLGCVLLGLATAIKGFPLVAAPVVLAWLWARGGRRELLRGTAALAVTVGLFAAVAVALSPDGAWESLDYQVNRPAQVESSQALVLRAMGAERITSHASVAFVHDADQLVSALFLGALCAVLGLLALGVAGAARSPGGARALVAASLAATTAFAALGEVLSPQFLAWVVPLGALAAGWRAWALAAAVAAASLLTLAEFPRLYIDLVDGEPFAMVVLIARDVALLVVVALAAWEVSRLEAEAAGSPLPAPGRPLRSAPR